MDNLVSQGTGASRLNFTQKVIASGMSLILAFGLSPLGQVPAYADEGGAQAAAIEAPTVETQQAEIHTATLGDYTISVSDVVFDGEDWANGTIGNDRLLKNGFLEVKELQTVGTTTKPVTVLGSAATGYTYSAGGKKEFTLSYKDPNGTAITKASQFTNAGTYTAVLKGEGEGTLAARAKVEVQFQVKRYDLKDVTKFDTTNIKNPESMAYMGKPLAVHYATGKYPKIEEGKDANDLDGTGTGTLKKLGTLQPSDVTFEPSTVTAFEPTGVTVNLVGAGNFTGSKEVTVKVTKGTFSTVQNLTVNGAVNSDANAASTTDNAAYKGTRTTGGATQQFLDLGIAKKNPTVADPDPAAQGKVVFGETVLNRDSDYEVTYYKALDASGTFVGVEALDSAPTKVGKGYYAVITATGGQFATDSTTHTVVVRYDITTGAAINEVADIADFGSASYQAPNVDASKAATVTTATQTAASQAFNTQQSLVVPTNVTFKNATGDDVTSVIGDNWRALKVKAWTEDLEREFLGEEGYSEKYPFSDKPYKNTAAVADYFTSTIKSTEKEADTYLYTNANTKKTTTYYGFNGLPAGDYQLFVVGDKDFPTDTSAQVYGKFTVSPAAASEGTGVGQLEFKAGEMAVTEDGLEGDEPTVKMHTGQNLATEDDVYTQNLKKGSAWAVASGTADYYLTYMKDGEQVDPDEDGTYDVQFNFGGSNFQEGTILVEDGLTVGKRQLNSLVKFALVDDSKLYQYTGSAVEPTIKLFSVAYEDETVGGKTIKGYKTLKQEYDTEKSKGATSAATKAAKKALDDVTLSLKKGTDYTVSYEGKSADTGSTPVAVGDYNVYLSGAGKYTTTYIKTGKNKADKRVKVYVDPTKGTEADKFKYTVAPLNLKDAIEKDYATVQFSSDNGATWRDHFSMLADTSNLKPEPLYRLVTSATKASANPTVIAKGLYSGEFDYDDITMSTGVGTVTLTLSPSADALAETPALAVTGQDGTATFNVAAGSLEDEALGANIVLTTASGTTEVESGTYAKEGQDLGIAVSTSGSPLAVEYKTGTEGNDQAQYVWEIRKGNKVLTDSTKFGGATRQAAELAAAAGIKDKVKDAGTYTINVYGSGSQYAGVLSKTFTVEPKEITSTDRKLEIDWKYNNTDDSRFDYTGNKITAIKNKESISYSDENDGATKVYFSEAESVEKGSGNQYVISGNKGTDAGTYTAKIEFCGNYTGTIEKTWTIRQNNIADLGLVYLADNLRLYGNDEGSYNPERAYYADGFYAAAYDGSAQEPTVKVYKPTYKGTVTETGETKVGDIVYDAYGYPVYTDLTPVKGLEYTYLYKDNVNATPDGNGRYESGAAVTIVASGGNFTGRVTRYFPITSLSLSADRVKVSFDDDDLAYTGKAVEPKGKLTFTNDDGSTFTMKYGTDYKVTYSGDNVNVGGNAVAKFTGLEPNFVGGNETFITKDFTVQENTKASQKISVLAGTSISKKLGDPAFNLGATTNGTDATIEYATSDAKVATVDANGNVTPVGAGTATITVTSAATKLFNAADPVQVKVTVASAAAEKAANSTFKVTAKKKSFAAKAKKKTTLKASKLYKVTGNKGGKVTYAKANKAGKKKITVAKNGKITVKKGLKAKTYKVKVKATAAATSTVKAASKTVTIKVKVKK